MLNETEDVSRGIVIEDVLSEENLLEAMESFEGKRAAAVQMV